MYKVYFFMMLLYLYFIFHCFKKYQPKKNLLIDQADKNIAKLKSDAHQLVLNLVVKHYILRLVKINMHQSLLHSLIWNIEIIFLSIVFR